MFLGSFLGGLFRAVMPLIKRGGMQLAKEVKRSGLNVLKDFITDGDIQTSLKKRSAEGLMNLHKTAFDTMEGRGYISRKRKSTVHSRLKLPTSRTKKKLVATRKTKKPKKKKSSKKRKAPTRKRKSKKDAFGTY